MTATSALPLWTNSSSPTASRSEMQEPGPPPRLSPQPPLSKRSDYGRHRPCRLPPQASPTAPTTPPAGGRAGQLIDAYWRVTHLRHELAHIGDTDREIATALAALDAVSLALTGAAMNALERETGHLFRSDRP